ncbi:translocation/assembly module TamB [Aliivibrio fischeri]|uniref:autotransporter assembly complex protein TamB n=1 Tax=Aliivibrio fischeri TaxID=668 RepID=UPI0012D89336|nr:translocation/assembly module TamB domain-containing protein [Aliivibrio fischeri]MUK76141.1 translocation/assembly module TamB [Aliivibrio fischeri]
MSSINMNEEHNNQELKKERRFSRHCLCFALFFPSILLLLLLIVGAVVFTNSGLKLIVWGAEKALPELSIEGVEGSVIPEFTLSNITYDNKQLLSTEIYRFHFSLTPKCLLIPSVCIDDISVDGLTLDFPTLPTLNEEEETDTAENKLLSIPIPIAITNITLNNIDANILGNHIQWRTFSTGVNIHKSELTLTPLNWEHIRLELASSESTAVKNKEKTTSSKKDDAPIVLPEVFIPLNIKVEQFALRDFILQQETPVKVNKLNFKATAGENNASINDFYLDIPQANLSLNNEIVLKGDYPLTLDGLLELKETELKGHKLAIEADGSVADLNASLMLSGGLKVKVDANVHPLDKKLPFDVHVYKGELYWPLTGDKDIKVQIPNIKTEGNLEQYNFASALYIEGKSIPQTDLRLEGRGTLEKVDLSDLLIDTLGGSISGSAEVNWASLVSWKTDINLQNIQPGLQWPEAEGDISGQLITDGHLTEDGGWVVDVPTIDINGVFRSYPLLVQGTLKADDIRGIGEPHLNISQLTINHGDNGLAVSGELNKEWNLNVDIDFPELSDSVPDVHGKLIGNVALTGELTKPRIDLDIDALGLQLPKKANLNKVSIEGYIVPSPTIDADLSIKLLDGKYQKQVLNDLIIRFSGKEQAHKLQIDLSSNVIDSHLVFKGSLDRTQGWKGELSEADVITEIGPWNLDKKADLAYDIKKEELFVQANCWSQGKTALCLNKDLHAGKSGNADISIKHFEFSKLQKFIPDETVINGEVNLDALAKWSVGQSPYVKAKLHLPKGNIQQQMESPLIIGWDDLTVNAEMKDDELTTDWLLALTDNGQLIGNMKIDQLTKAKTLTGNSKIEKVSLAMLEPILGEYSQLRGMVNSDINISGPIEHPKLLGNFSVDEIKVKGEVSPVDINEGNVDIVFSGHSGKLSSLITTADGDLHIDGAAHWSDLNKWDAGLDIFGNELQVNVPPMVKLKVKPDMKIRINPTLAKITGSIGIPWGRIVVQELPESAIGVSKDEVILGDDLKPIEKPSPLPMTVETDININIGDDVLLSAFGLEGGLVGNLNITQKNKGPFITGEVNIEEGTYRSFGQDLQIRKGKILFNGPADQPYVDIKAVRNPENTKDDVVAGIKVTGPADTPRVEIFSSPSMPQANALSYLLRGQDIDGESGGNAMTTTLIGLSLAKSGKVVGEIGQAFGVQDLQLDTAGSGEDSQVTISGYIAPGLQVKYGVGIFNSLGEFTLRYRIISDLYIEAVSGVDNAVDLIYQFEFD